MRIRPPGLRRNNGAPLAVLAWLVLLALVISRQANATVTASAVSNGTVAPSKNNPAIRYRIDKPTNLRTRANAGVQGGAGQEMGVYAIMDASVPLAASGPLFLRSTVSSP